MSDAVHGFENTSPPPPEPSGIPRTIGILSIVFGALFTLSSLSNVLFAGRPFLVRSQRAQAGPMIELSKRVAPYTQTDGGVMLLMSVALLIIGIGLYGYREAARKAAIVWSVAAFPVLAFRAWLQETRIWPIARDIMHEATELAKARGRPEPPFNMEALTTSIAHGSQYVILGLLAIFPALLLILLHLDAVKQSMRDR